jgi:hypothetical protein
MQIDAVDWASHWSGLVLDQLQEQEVDRGRPQPWGGLRGAA